MGRSSLQFHAAPLTLSGLDALDVPDLVAFVGPEERPLRGLAGLVDWRLCGALTRMIKENRFAGAAGEALLTVAGGRIPAERIFLFGTGAAATGSPALYRRAFEAVAAAGGRRIASALPAGEVRPQATCAGEIAAEAERAGLERLVLLREDPRAALRSPAGAVVASRPDA